MDLSLCISQIPEVPMQGLWHQGPRTKYQLLDSLKSPVLNVLSKEHSRNISVPIAQPLGSCETYSSPSGSEAKSAVPRPHPADGNPWKAHLASGPGFLAWPCLGPGLMGEPGLLQTPAESRVSGAWETHP